MRFIGCKTLLLENIKEVVDEKAPGANSFCDIFSGTATVARFFKQWYEVYSNDLLYFSYVLQKGTIENDEVPKFEILKKELQISEPIDYFNAMVVKKTIPSRLQEKERRNFRTTRKMKNPFLS